ncbi:hypothetical protein [Candidatus Kuenenia sp.]|uniref:hypothetical protein n=1 Tax=Candidatus Kuenenia sp. TaxID=2499824 RepID=UPI0032205792
MHTLYASPLDFSWIAPKTYVHNEGTKGELLYIVWFYNLKNTMEKTITAPIDVFLKTDTGEEYADAYYPELVDYMKELDEDFYEGKKYQSAAIAKGELAPDTTKHCIAMFEDIAPQTKQVEIFVTGISHFFSWRRKMVDYSYKITYKKERNQWKLIEHGMSKEWVGVTP